MARASQADPLRAALQNLRIPITTDVGTTDTAARLDEDHWHLLDEATTLTAARRRMESTQREYHAACGFTPAAAEPSRVVEVWAHNGAIGRALGAAPASMTPPSRTCVSPRGPWQTSSSWRVRSCSSGSNASASSSPRQTSSRSVSTRTHPQHPAQRTTGTSTRGIRRRLPPHNPAGSFWPAPERVVPTQPRPDD